MLSRILELWRGKSLVSQMLDEFMEMLDLGKSMFDSVTSVGFDGGDLEAVREEFYTKETRMNKLEQSIRRKILVHLSVQGDTDVPACLVLMNAAKDAERLGDYGKNIYDVFRRAAPLDPGLYFDQLLQLAEEISAAYASVASVFKESDAQAARELRESNYRLEKQCDSAINELLAARDADKGVAYALLFRFFKRTLAHLSNIVSSVVMPVDKMDYFEKTDDATKQESTQTV